MRFVDIEEARAAAGLRLVIAGNVPSPWSQAAMGIFDIKGIDYIAVEDLESREIQVHCPRDEDVSFAPLA